MASKVVEISNIDDYQMFKERYPRGIIMYSAEWCEACKDIFPLYARIAARYHEMVAMAHVDIDVCGLDFNRVPIFVSLYQGEELDSIEGADKESLKRLIKEAILFEPQEEDRPHYEDPPAVSRSAEEHKSHPVKKSGKSAKRKRRNQRRGT